METGYLRKSIKKVANDYNFNMPNPRDMPKTGTGKSGLEQGRGLKKIIESVLQKYAEEIEEEARNKCL